MYYRMINELDPIKMQTFGGGLVFALGVWEKACLELKLERRNYKLLHWQRFTSCWVCCCR